MNPENKDTVFYVLLGISLILTRVPVIGIYFRIVNTMIHETGHALTALFTSGSVLRMELLSNTEGNAVTKSNSKLASTLVALMGYPASSAIALLFFYLLKTDNHITILWSLAGIAAIDLIFFVRNRFGIFWLSTFLIIMAAVLYFKNPFLQYAFSVFFSLIILTDSLISAIQLLIISILTPKKAGDAKNLKNFTKIPAMFWALLFVVFAVYMVWLSVSLFFDLPALSSLL